MMKKKIMGLSLKCEQTTLPIMKTRWVRAIKAHLAASDSRRNKSVNTSSALKPKARLAVKLKVWLYLEDLTLKTTALKQK